MVLIASKVVNRTEEVHVQFNDEDTLTMFVRVNALNHRFARTAGDEDDKFKQGLDYIVRVVDRWDFVEDDGETMVPLTFKRLADLLSIQMVNKIIEGIQGQMFPDPSKAPLSSPTLLLTETTELDRNGTH